MHQRAAERGALQHAAGELPGMLVAEGAEPDFLEQRVGAVAELGLVFGAVFLPEWRHDLQRHHHVVAHREPGQHGRVLKRHADAHRLGADLAPGDIDVAAARIDQSGDQLEDGRFAATGGTDQRDEIALLDAQIGVAERDDLLVTASVGERDIFQFDEVSPGCAVLRRMRRRSCGVVLALHAPASSDGLHRGFGVAHGRRRHLPESCAPSGPSPCVSGTSVRSFMTKRPRTSVWIGRPLTLRPFHGEIFERDCSLASSMVWARARSTMAMSASAPG